MTADSPIATLRPRPASAAEMLSILHTESSLGWGGQEIRVLTEAQGFVERGHHVVIGCPEEAKIHAAARKRGLPTCTLPIARKGLRGLLEMRAWLAARGGDFDIVNTHSSTDSWLVALACATLGDPPPIVRTRHLSTAVDRSFASRWLYQGACSHVVTTGERLREQLHRDNGVALERMTSVPTGIDLSRYTPGDRHAARAAVGLVARPTIGIVATLRGWKGHAHLLDAWGALRERFPDWQVAIVGDGPQAENLAMRIAGEAMGDRVTMAGNRDDVEVWLRAFDLFVLPSWGNEGVPQAILQAMAAGLPVVATTVGAIDEAVAEGITGFLVPPRDAGALEARLAQLMGDEALRARLGAAGRERALTRFGLELMVERMQSVFEAARASARRRRTPETPPLSLALPYNEILPKRSAHDVHVFRTAVTAARAGARAALLHGKGGEDDESLLRHYHIDPEARFASVRLPIVRRNLGLPLTFNAVFNHCAQQWIRRHRPDWVLNSVLKLGRFHHSRRVAGVRYAYEVHELAWYPGREAAAAPIAMEREMLSRADLVIATTGALREILRAEPYAIATRIEVLPLAAAPAPALPGPPATAALRLAYVGQLYREQGVALLLEALAEVPAVRLDVVGGRPDEVEALGRRAESLGLGDRVQWHGFVAPASIPGIAARAHAFVAPFLAEGRMPFVAHTKLAEYRGWKRPVIAPDLPTVREHFASGGAVCFRPGDAHSLAAAIRVLQDGARRAQLTEEIAARAPGDWTSRARDLVALLAHGAAR